MANTNLQFQKFNDNLKIPSSKTSKMNDARESARSIIYNWFKKHKPEYPVSFWIQGSHKNHLNIRTENDDCDQDDGIYIDRDPNASVDGTDFQEWIVEALTGSTAIDVEHRSRCVRNYYSPYNLGSFHIDYPSYYKTDEMPHPKLTVKNKKLEESDPKEFTNWLENETDDKGQLRRIIRFLKGWCNFKGSEHDMLNGLTLTVLVCRNYEPVDDRDDEAVYLTLKGIQAELNDTWECLMPSVPYDDLLGGYDESFKCNFMNTLSDLINDGKKALNEASQHEASKLWKKHMGSRYPLAPKPLLTGKRNALGALVRDNKPYFDGF